LSENVIPDGISRSKIADGDRVRVVFNADELFQHALTLLKDRMKIGGKKLSELSLSLQHEYSLDDLKQFLAQLPLAKLSELRIDGISQEDGDELAPDFTDISYLQSLKCWMLPIGLQCMVPDDEVEPVQQPQPNLSSGPEHDPEDMSESHERAPKRQRIQEPKVNMTPKDQAAANILLYGRKKSPLELLADATSIDSTQSPIGEDYGLPEVSSR
jgi:hypothetical protein